MATELAYTSGMASFARQQSGALQGAPSRVTSHLLDPTDQWLKFAVNQASRVAQHPDLSSLVASNSSKPFRLRLAHLEGLPLFQAERCNFEVRVGVTLYDNGSGSGAFFGNTCYSAPVAYDMRKSKGKKGFHVDLGADMFFHTKAAISGELCAVVEVVLVERTQDGVINGEYSAGWAQVPLQLLHGQSYSPMAPGDGTAPSSPARSPSRRTAPSSAPTYSAARGVQYTSSQQGTCFVAVFTGSPRYLVLKKVFPEQAYPLQQLMAGGAECRLHFVFEACSEMEGWRPLLPENFLVSYHDVVPGVHRLDAATGLPTSRFLGACSLLLESRLCSTHAMLLSELQLQLPCGFLEVVRNTLLVAGSPGPSSVHGGYAGSPGRMAVPLRELQQCLRVRASVHNGRTFVGPAVWAKRAGLETSDGRRGEHCVTVSEDVALAWVPADVMVAIVLELVLVANSAADAADPDNADCTVLAWGAATPFSRISGDGGAVVAEGAKQVFMKSGPGHWVRHAPVLDWRRLLERTNRISPEPPVACFALRHLEGMGIWPPPQAPLKLSFPPVPSLNRHKSESVQVQLPSKQPTSTAAGPTLPSSAAEAQAPKPIAAESSCSRDARRLQSGASEAETLCTVRGRTASREAVGRKGNASQAANVAPYKTITRAETINLWQINAHYDRQQPGPTTSEDPMHPAPAPVKTRIAGGQRTKGDEEALYVGSPMAQYGGGIATSMIPAPAAGMDNLSSDWWYLGSKGQAAVRWNDVAALSTTATPFSHSLARHVDLGTELVDARDTNSITLQFVGYAPAHDVTMDSLGGRSGSKDTVLAAAPDGDAGCIHFTFRFFNQQPIVTAPARPQLLPSGSSGRRCKLCALLPVGGGSSRGQEPAAPAGTAATLDMYTLEQLEQQVELLEAQGVAECRASAIRQLRLRAAHYLAERWMQVDVWDSTSLLQVGTFSIPLRGLLRQGQELAEVVYECPIHDQAQMVQRASEPASLASAPLKGSIFVRMINRGRQGGLAAADDQPASPSKQQHAAVVVRAKPALEEAGQIMQELAGPNAATSPRTLKDEIIQKAQQKVQRILHYRHVSDPAGKEGEPDLGRLVHDQVLADIEQARDRCKPDLILKKLQQELPANVAICVGPGEAAAFEREFVNPSHEEALFEVSSTSPAQLALVADGQEWQVLCDSARYAGLISPANSSMPRHVITNHRFKLGSRQRGVLRFKWQTPAMDAQQAAAHIAHVSITRVEKCGPDSNAACTHAQPSQSPNLRLHVNQHATQHHHHHHHQQQQQQQASAATAATLVTFKVVVLGQPMLVDRTLRVYHAAGPGQATVTQSVLFSRLPAAEGLVRSDLRVACGPGMTAAVMRGSAPHQPAGLLLSFQPPPAGASLCCHLAASCGTASGSPCEAWQVFVHSLPCLEMTAVVGETVSIEKRVAAEATEGLLQLSCHGLCRDELQFSPCELDVSPGTQARMQLSYTPQAPSKREALVMIVDDVRQRPIDMMLVRLDSTATRISRTFEVTVERGKKVSKKVSYTNPYQQTKAFTLRTTHPDLLQFAQPDMQVAAGSTTNVRMTFDASGTDMRSHDLLVFVDNKEEKRVEEAFRIMLRIT